MGMGWNKKEKETKVEEGELPRSKDEDNNGEKPGGNAAFSFTLPSYLLHLLVPASSSTPTSPPALRPDLRWLWRRLGKSWIYLP